MPKLRTTSDLQDALDEEYAWRLKELADLKRSMRDTSGGPQRTLIRAGIALAYAHWEGFVKSSAEHFLNFVSHRGLQYQQLRACFVMRGLKKEIDVLATARPGQRSVRAAEFVLGKLESRASIPFNDAVNAKSNLSSTVFEDIAESVGISAEPYETKQKFIDERLVARRNRIAHGEFLDIEPADFEGIVDQVIELLRSFKTDIENAMVLETYRKQERLM